VVSAGTVCRAAGTSAVCDPAETCSGASNACPSNTVAANGTSCDDGNATTSVDQCASGLCAGTLTCADGIQNQGETGVDCGGPCGACANGCTPSSLTPGVAVNLAASFSAVSGNFHPQGLGLASDGVSFSVVQQSTKQIRTMNPTTGALVTTINLSNTLNHTTGIAYSPTLSQYFVADYTSNTSGPDLWRFTTAGTATQASTEVLSFGGYPLAVGNGILYRGNTSTGYDWSTTNKIRVSAVGTPDTITATLQPNIGGIEDMAWDGSALWVLGYTTDSSTATAINLYRINPTTGAVLASYLNVANSGAGRRAAGVEFLNSKLYIYNWSSGGTSTLLPITLNGCL
jgi:hypothetical protein